MQDRIIQKTKYPIFKKPGDDRDYVTLSYIPPGHDSNTITYEQYRQIINKDFETCSESLNKMADKWLRLQPQEVQEAAVKLQAEIQSGVISMPQNIGLNTEIKPGPGRVIRTYIKRDHKDPVTLSYTPPGHDSNTITYEQYRQIINKDFETCSESLNKKADKWLRLQPQEVQEAAAKLQAEIQSKREVSGQNEDLVDLLIEDLLVDSQKITRRANQDMSETTNLGKRCFENYMANLGGSDDELEDQAEKKVKKNTN